MSENEQEANGGVPPKVDPRKLNLARDDAKGAPPEASAKRQTARIDLPPLEAGKKKTSKIPLSAFLPDTGDATAPIGSSEPPETTAVPAPRADELDVLKKTTSRIPLEAVLAGTEGIGAAPSVAPKTIRIKRPTQAPTIKLTRTSAPEEAAAAEPGGGKSKTSRIDLPAESTEAAAPTQRKTIKIKRPEPGAQAARTLTISRPETAAVAPGEGDKAATETPGLAFSLAAVISLVIVCVLIYVLAVQALPGLGLSFPGRVM